MAAAPALGVALTYLIAKGDDFEPAIYWGIFLAGFFTSIGFSTKSQSYLLRAINSYNGVEYPQTSQWKFNLKTTKDQTGFAIIYDF